MGAQESKPSHVQEDVLDSLKRFDTVLVVDDSASMHGKRWAQAGEALANLAYTAAKYDADGIEIHFINSRKFQSHAQSAKVVKKLFKSVILSGSTPLGGKMNVLLSDYLARLEQDPTTKPVNFIVITDGAPTDYPKTKLEDTIVEVAEKLDAQNASPTQIGIQFVQIGDAEGATEYLEKLDNDLKVKHGIRDMVDTTLSEPEEDLDIVKILVGAINRRVDVKGSAVLTGA
ncbi:hypothetical protein Hypma_004624 [Hypsizygus marmoreus]|uniref:VWFA domain-containing protein n=1 Tax=Hypsizygus marmoreus TaxID=39966 RepID=A0A369JXP6_HYPMA|nr:hypothetical protein Hypma_004624 [Hypsizygus marmoreus]